VVRSYRGRPVKGEGSGLDVAQGGGHGGSRTGSYDQQIYVVNTGSRRGVRQRSDPTDFELKAGRLRYDCHR
jgi:hypothetical protein